MTFKHRAAAVAVLLALAACGETARSLAAREPGDDALCALDGMSIKDYPGPKAQIVFKDGRIDYFCTLAELFENDTGRQGVDSSYVQDMGRADWDKPRGHWIPAATAFYVLDSRAQGAMGPTIGTFARQQDAQAFVVREGGRVLDYSQVQRALRASAALGAKAAHDDAMR